MYFAIIFRVAILPMTEILEEDAGNGDGFRNMFEFGRGGADIGGDPRCGRFKIRSVRRSSHFRAARARDFADHRILRGIDQDKMNIFIVLAFERNNYASHAHHGIFEGHPRGIFTHVDVRECILLCDGRRSRYPINRGCGGVRQDFDVPPLDAAFGFRRRIRRAIVRFRTPSNDKDKKKRGVAFHIGIGIIENGD